MTTDATPNNPGARRTANTEKRRDENLARIGRVIAVMSGKGGVGKSTVATGLAVGLARLGKRTGLLDVDFHGPSVPTMLGIREMRPTSDGHRLDPIELGPDLQVMSLGLLTGGGDEAVIWRGPMKIGVINQLLGDVTWGDLDVLVLDCPPGTGDEPLSVGQVIPTARVVVVGTPQEVAMADVRRAVAFCEKLSLSVLGLVETMGTMVCPSCAGEVPLFGGKDVRRPEGVPLLAEVPFDPDLHAACDAGRLSQFIAGGGPTAERLMELARRVSGDAEPTDETNPSDVSEAPPLQNPDPNRGDNSTMRYAIPTADGRLAMHFGHADTFTFVDVTDGEIGGTSTETPPAHAPGVLPAWLKEQNVDVILAGGMGSRAQGLFAGEGIDVVVGSPAEEPRALVEKHLAGRLATGDNVCDH